MSPLHSCSPAQRVAEDFESFVRDIFQRSFAVNIAHTPTAFVLMAALPGVARERVDVSTREQVLYIKVSPLEPKAPVEGEAIVDRREFGSFHGERAFPFNPARIDVSGLAAKLENGILTVTVPKKDPESRRVDIG